MQLTINKSKLSNAIVNSVTLKSDDANSQTISFTQGINLNGLSTVKDEIYTYVDGSNLVTKKIQRYGTVDLGTLSWNVYPSGLDTTFFATLNDSSVTNRLNFICAKYTTEASPNGGNNMQDKLIGGVLSADTRKILFIRDSAYTDSTSLKSSLNGIILTYELDTPTITTIETTPIASGFVFEDIENVLVSNTNAGISDTTNEVVKGKAVAPSLQSVEIVNNPILGKLFYFNINSNGLITEVEHQYNYNLAYFRVYSGNTYSFTTDNDIVYAYYLNIPSANSQSINNIRYVVEGQTSYLFTSLYNGYVAFRFKNNYSVPIITLQSDKIASIKAKVEAQGKVFELGDIDYNAKTFTQKYESRAYQSGDEDNTSYITDGFATTIVPLATTTPIDISDILTDDDIWLTTEAGGTVTLNNTDKLSLNYDIDWLKLGGTT